MGIISSMQKKKNDFLMHEILSAADRTEYTKDIGNWIIFKCRWGIKEKGPDICCLKKQTLLSLA